jgi:hypothetical protein
MFLHEQRRICLFASSYLRIIGLAAHLVKASRIATRFGRAAVLGMGGVIATDRAGNADRVARIVFKPVIPVKPVTCVIAVTAGMSVSGAWRVEAGMGRRVVNDGAGKDLTAQDGAAGVVSDKGRHGRMVGLLLL